MYVTASRQKKKMMKPAKRKSFILITGGIVFLCLILFIIPFFWKQPVFWLLKSNLFNGYRKAGLIALYNPAPPDIIREHVDLYNGGFKPQNFRAGPVYIPGKGYNYMDSLGLLMTSDFYRMAEPFCNGLGRVNTETGYGMLNHKGKWVLTPQYDTIIPFEQVLIVKQENRYGVTGEKGRFLIPLQEETISTDYNNFALPFLLAYRRDGSFSVIHPKGKPSEAAPYDSLDIRNNTLFVRRNNFWGVLDYTGSEIIPLIYDRVGVYKPGLYTVTSNGLQGFHLPGEPTALIPLLYEKVDICTPETYRVFKDNHYGLLDKKAAILIEPVYDTIYAHHGKEWIVTGDHNRYALRNTNNLSFPSGFYEMIGPCREGMTVVRNEDGYGVLSEDGAVTVIPQYDSIRHYSSNLAVVYHNRQYGAIDKTGAFTIPFSLKLVELYDFHDGIALAAQLNLMTARIRKQYGFIDKDGNTVVPFIYEDGHKVFSNGLAGMRLNGAWGFINIKGENIIPFLYDTVTRFSNGMSQAVYHGSIHTIDTQGRTVE